MNGLEPRFEDVARLRFSIEGVGQVVEKFYFPALQHLRSELRKDRRDLDVTFYDSKSTWIDGPRHIVKQRKSFIKKLVDWGATYIDKDPINGQRQYDERESDVTFICSSDDSHVELALRWRTAATQIFIEKPLDRSPARVRQLLGKVPVLDSRVLTFDHYLARFLPSVDQRKLILDFLGRKITSFMFYFLEDGSQGPLNGPIENDGREKSLEEGMILDGLPHMGALLAFFGRVESIRVTSVRAGQYTGVKYDNRLRTSIKGETLAEVDFVFKEHRGGEYIPGKAFVGKGVSGARDVPLVSGVFPSDVKLLDVSGSHGQMVRFDLRRRGRSLQTAKFRQPPSTAHLVSQDGSQVMTFNLNRLPHNLLMSSVADGSYYRRGLGLHAETAMLIMRSIEDMRARDNPKKKYATYPLGPKGGKALILEDAIRHLPYVYGQPR